MMAKKVSDDVLLEAYARVGNVWKVADEVGMCGQSVHERLVRLGKINKMNIFTEADKKILIDEYSSFKSRGCLSELAEKMGRTKQFICRKAKEVGLTNYKGVRPYAEKEGSNPYWRHHDRVRSLKGSPHQCEVCGENSRSKTYDWANLTGEYESPDDYKRMCRICHRKHDKNRVMLAHKKQLS